MDKVFSDKKVIFSLVLPGVLLFVAAVLFPLAMSVIYSMTDMQGSFQSASYVGFQNYIKLLTEDTTFRRALLHAIMLGLGYMVIQHPICITYAIILDRMGGRAEKLFRVIFFIPCVISIMVTSKMWVNIMNPNYGMLNKLFDAIGMSFLKSQWLSSPDTALSSLFFIIMWQGFGWGLLIYYAGLKSIPPDIYEAAHIDGATGLRTHLLITLPLLMPVIKVNVTLGMINALKQMDTVYLTTGGGPGDSTQFVATYLYKRAFDAYQFGYGNAISVVFVIVCLSATWFYQRVIRGDLVEY